MIGFLKICLNVTPKPVNVPMKGFFWGGWDVPFWDQPNWIEPIVVLVKTLFWIFIFIWVRATLPRLRYDQLMSFGWKILLPLATLNALVTAVLVVVLD